MYPYTSTRVQVLWAVLTTAAMKTLKRLLHKSISKAPPKWTPAPEESVWSPLSTFEWSSYITLQHVHGKLFEAPGEEYEAAEQFCQRHPPSLPRTLPSHVIDEICRFGAALWGFEHPTLKRFSGTITAAVDNRRNPGVINVQSRANCGDVCLMSNLPILAGLYDIRGQSGVYYEIMINRMEGIIAIGAPIPHFTFTINLKPTAVRHGVSSLSRLSFPRLEQTQRWVALRRFAQILWGSRRWTWLHSRTYTYRPRWYHRMCLRVRNWCTILYSQWPSSSGGVLWTLPTTPWIWRLRCRWCLR